MDLELRQRLRSIYGKNRPTPATQFAMILLLHVISTPWTQGRFIPFVPVQSKGDGFSFRSHLNVGAPAVGVSSLRPKAREPSPTWVTRLHVAIHVAGVIFGGHNDVGVDWLYVFT